MVFSNFVERTTHSDSSTCDIIGIDTSSDLGTDDVVYTVLNVIVHTVPNLQFDT